MKFWIKGEGHKEGGKWEWKYVNPNQKSYTYTIVFCIYCDKC